MKYKEFKMPVFGVGPVYVIACLILTILGICFHLKGYLYQGELIEGKIVFIIAGIVLILLGIYLWIQAVMVQKINKKVKENKLITKGVYALVRMTGGSGTSGSAISSTAASTVATRSYRCKICFFSRNSYITNNSFCYCNITVGTILISLVAKRYAKDVKGR